MNSSYERLNNEVMKYYNTKYTETKKVDEALIEVKPDKVLTLSIYYDDVYLEKLCIDPFQYIISAPGKSVRHKLIDTFNYWLKAPEDIVTLTKETTYLIHNSSILLDDIQDESLLRRGIPCGHKVFSTSNVMSATNLSTLTVLMKLRKMGNPKATLIYLESCLDLIRGQTIELYWRDNHTCPTIQEYRKMCCQKTGAILMLICNMLQLFSKENVETDRLIMLLGQFFQINDDYQNLTSQFFYDSKGFCEDISEGKFGYPIVHAASVNPEVGKKLTDILRQKTEDFKLKKYCLSLIEECGSFEHTRQLIKELKAAIFEEVDKLGHNPYFEGFFEILIKASL